MANVLLFLGSIFALLAVALGAFGAHALKTKLTDKMMTVFQTGVLYHLIHSLGLIMVAILVKVSESSNSLPIWSGWMIVIGILFFSGSLYVISLSKRKIKRLGLLTPLGGLAFLIGWFLLAIYAFYL